MKKSGLTDDSFRTMIQEMQQGLVGDSPGEGLYKKRAHLPRRGKSSLLCSCCIRPAVYFPGIKKSATVVGMPCRMTDEPDGTQKPAVCPGQ